MIRKRRWLVFVLVIFTLIPAALARVPPAEATIDKGLVPSAIKEGYAKLDLAKAACDCDTSVVSAKLDDYEN